MNRTNYRLEVHDLFGFLKENWNKKEQSLMFSERVVLVYTEYYSDYISLKQRILELSKIWFESNDKDKGYPSFLIYDRKNEFGRISFTSKGWLPPTNAFYGYLVRHLANLYGDKYRDYLLPLKGEMITFIGPEWDGVDVNEIELVSDELIDILLRKFFDNRLISDETLNKALHHEIVSRNYV